jgi:hypothetical protein
MSNVTSTWGTPGGRDPVQDEPAQGLVVRREVALALEDVDLHLRLVVRGSGEDLALRGRDRRVPLDELGHDAAERLDAERERRDVQQEDVLDVARQDAGLDRGADRHDLVRVDAPVRLLATEHRLDRLDDRGHPGHAAHQDDLVDLGRAEARVLDRLDDGAPRLLDEVAHEVLELSPREGDDQMLRAGGVCGDVGQVDLRGDRRRELDLRLLGCLLEALERLRIGVQVDSLVLLELGEEPVHDPDVEVVAAEVGVSVG